MKSITAATLAASLAKPVDQSLTTVVSPFATFSANKVSNP